jgi:hypothetical protein
LPSVSQKPVFAITVAVTTYVGMQHHKYHVTHVPVTLSFFGDGRGNAEAAAFSRPITGLLIGVK